jgi:quinoprotein glucose dehydrogenase
MEAAGSAPPILFSLDGKQYVSFLSTGGIYDNYKEKESVIYTFSIE